MGVYIDWCITEQQPRKSSNKDVIPFLASFNISGSTLRIILNNSTFREEREKSKGAGNIRNISVLIGHKQGFVILYRHFLYFINSFSIFKLKGFKRFVALGETAGQYGVFLVLTIVIHN